MQAILNLKSQFVISKNRIFDTVCQKSINTDFIKASWGNAYRPLA